MEGWYGGCSTGIHMVFVRCAVVCINVGVVVGVMMLETTHRLSTKGKRCFLQASEDTEWKGGTGPTGSGSTKARQPLGSSRLLSANIRERARAQWVPRYASSNTPRLTRHSKLLSATTAVPESWDDPTHRSLPSKAPHQQQ